MKLTLELPDELHREIQLLADNAQTTDEEAIIAALREYVERKSRRRAVESAGGYVEQKNEELYKRLATGR